MSKTSKHRGVHLDKDVNKYGSVYYYWIATLKFESKTYTKRCVSELRAAKAYNDMCLELGLFERMYDYEK